MKKYYFAHHKPLLTWYDKNHKINKGSLLDFNRNFTVSSLAFMPANALDSSLHLLPIKFVFDIPREKTNKSYAELMDERASELVNLAKSQNQTITALWSGGIDSTTVLVSLLKQNIDDRLIVACNAQSIYENRDLFDRYINNKVKIQYVQDIDYSPNAGTFFVRTTGSATFMGGDLQTLFLYSYRDQVLDSPSREMFGKMFNFFIPLMTDYQLDLLYNQIIECAKVLNVQLETMWDLISFYDITFKVNNEYWAQDFPYLFLLNHSKEVVQNLDSWSARFYMTPEFYKWGLYSATVEDRIGYTLFEFKKVMKDYIYDFNKDLNYYENKIKVSSYGKNPMPSKYSNYLTIDTNYNYSHPQNDKILVEQLHEANNKII